MIFAELTILELLLRPLLSPANLSLLSYSHFFHQSLLPLTGETNKKKENGLNENRDK